MEVTVASQSDPGEPAYPLADDVFEQRATRVERRQFGVSQRDGPAVRLLRSAGAAATATDDGDSRDSEPRDRSRLREFDGIMEQIERSRCYRIDGRAENGYSGDHPA